VCTVTFIKTNSGFVLTSNRDEKNNRKTLTPDYYQHINQRLYYPKDEKAGGTWIASNLINRTACLLNGAFMAHQKQPYHTLSRGKILLASFNSPIQNFINETALNQVEPFTLLIIDNTESVCLHELVWDGIAIHHTSYQDLEYKIWSSSTLYRPEIQAQRNAWFETWIEQHKFLEDKNILNFHKHRHTETESDNILMKRENAMQTVSITQVISKNGGFSLDYLPI